jgi:chromosome segregation ATPase
MDAISFVLGISSKNLRSHNLKELIYRSDDFLPDSCFVELTLKDEEANEYVFRRSVDKTGASSYI